MKAPPEHWNTVYGQRSPTEVSWFQPEATRSLDVIARANVPLSAAIVDVGAGASTLVDGLLARGYTDISLVDVAEKALAETRRRLVTVAGGDAVHYVVSDVTRWEPARPFDLWHDRATFHFLTEESDRDAYRKVLASALAFGGQAILATFAADGPERCSGLPVRRYSAEGLAAEFAGFLRLVEAERVAHVTPAGGTQAFVFARFARV